MIANYLFQLKVVEEDTAEHLVNSLHQTSHRTIIIIITAFGQLPFLLKNVFVYYLFVSIWNAATIL